MSVDEIVGVLEEKVCDCSEDMLLDLAELLLRYFYSVLLNSQMSDVILLSKSQLIVKSNT